ncbi:MAG: potassium channel family protein [Gammaproteobacteria bacterium]|nr:potassium channel family protein [Gammaproteobacteria bacterium]MDX2460338.1 potassium channel family protein [Gammaproteobacteria bacterium]
MGTKNNRFFFLLGGLLVALLVTPVMTEHYPQIGGTMLTITLVISALSMSAAKRTYKLAWSLVAMKIVLDVVGSTTPIPGVFIAEWVVLSVFFIVATVFALGRVLEDDYVDLNRIAGAISVYMLIGLIWTSLYFALSLVDPRAFEGIAVLSNYREELTNTAYLDLLYYSYVTLSTLGYGDVTPVSRAAQSLSYLEAICGVMYVAVLVAALIGSYSNRPADQSR